MNKTTGDEKAKALPPKPFRLLHHSLSRSRFLSVGFCHGRGEGEGASALCGAVQEEPRHPQRPLHLLLPGIPREVKLSRSLIFPLYQSTPLISFSNRFDGFFSSMGAKLPPAAYNSGEIPRAHDSVMFIPYFLDLMI